MSRKLNERRILKYITEYLILSLDELKGLITHSEFNEGTFWAFLECLEILSKWEGFKNYRISDVEKHFGAPTV